MSVQGWIIKVFFLEKLNIVGCFLMISSFLLRLGSWDIYFFYELAYVYSKFKGIKRLKIQHILLNFLTNFTAENAI